MEAEKSKIENITAAKPKIGGAVYVAKLGTDLPTDAKTALNEAFLSLGYCSEDGLTNDPSRESSSQKAWGGANVLEMFTAKKDTFKYKLIEALNVNVLKTVYGTNNVDGDLESGITIKSKNEEPEEFSWVFEMILRGNVLKRIVVPKAAISEIGEIVYKDDNAVGYECTINAIENDEGISHYEYIVKKGE